MKKNLKEQEYIKSLASFYTKDERSELKSKMRLLLD